MNCNGIHTYRVTFATTDSFKKPPEISVNVRAVSADDALLMAPYQANLRSATCCWQIAGIEIIEGEAVAGTKE